MIVRNTLAGAFVGACNLFLLVCGILGQNADPLLYRKPWPTYSLQNMPQTRFTCHDKILGGYYADAETQCQMFHVCVKVAGVGVQDFRFLCPNGTAFDQEAQICADWGDVDCEQSVLYYGSDNFDLYRLGSGFESKRAPLAEEDEATYHLQRAESGDIRRSKETRVDQKSRPEQPPNYTKHFEAATTRNSFHNYAPSAHNRNTQPQKSNKSHLDVEAAKKPIINYYTPTTTTSTTTSTPTTTTTTERYNDESKQEFDEIFKGSHSSHFFSNRNGGREDDYQHDVKTKNNDFNDYNRKTHAEQTTTTKARSQPTRTKRIKPATTTTTTTTITRSTTVAPPSKVTKKFSQQTSYSTDFFDYSQAQRTSHAPLTQTTTKSKTTTTQRPTTHHSSAAHRFSFSAHDYQTQEKIQPTTYNPGNSFYHLKVTTPKYTELTRTDSNNKNKNNKNTETPKTDARNSTYVNQNEFGEFFKVAKPQRGQTYQQQQHHQQSQPQQHQEQPPQPFQPSAVFRAPHKTQNYEKPSSSVTQRTNRGHSNRVTQAEPSPFRQRSAAKETKLLPTEPKQELKPRGFSSRGSINYKATTTTTTTTAFSESSTQGAKKFSTLVPKDQYTPTTFKPTTYKKPYDNSYNYQSQQTVKPNGVKSVPKASTYATSAPTTANPYYNVDEDDGQYHPELYEVDYPKRKLNLQRSSTATAGTSTKTTPKSQHSYNTVGNFHSANPTPVKSQQASEPVDLSDEEELFKTAHSLNFGAASINKLRADIFKAEKTSQQYNSQYSPNGLTASTSAASTTTTTTTTTRRPPTTTSRTTIGASQYYTTTYSTSTPITTPTTARPIYTTTQRTTYPTYELKSAKPKSTKSSTKSNGKGKGKSAKKSTSKRPPHADEDTSYDYAYYDTDSLSETPQDYHEYEIAEFSKTRKN